MLNKKKKHAQKMKIWNDNFKSNQKGDVFSNGWGSRIWTYECWSQSPMPYRLAIPQY